MTTMIQVGSTVRMQSGEIRTIVSKLGRGRWLSLRPDGSERIAEEWQIAEVV